MHSLHEPGRAKVLSISSPCIMSGISSQRSLALCRCECPPLPGSPGSAQHNTSGICTHILSSCWRGRCRSLSRSTSLHSCPCHGRSGYTPGQLSQGTLQRERSKGNAAKVRRRVLRKDSKHMKIGIGDLICKVFDPLTLHHPGFNIKPEKCL